MVDSNNREIDIANSFPKPVQTLFGRKVHFNDIFLNLKNTYVKCNEVKVFSAQTK